MTIKRDLQVGDTIRLKRHLKVGKDYDGITFLKRMDYGFDRFTVVMVDDSQVVLLKGSDGYTWLYPFAMLDFRTIRRKKDEQSV